MNSSVIREKYIIQPNRDLHDNSLVHFVVHFVPDAALHSFCLNTVHPRNDRVCGDCPDGL